MTKHTPHTLIDWFIKDKDGKVALAQMPNLPLVGWAVFGLLAFIFGKGIVHNGFHNLSQASLFTWAYLEIRSGLSPARKTLGAAVMIVLTAGYFRN